ncbi:MULTISPECIES: YycH family regulatory protein [Salimicrobium]|uniref:Two-component signal transduction system YycFG, regulatory protein YycH n=2 Tax=Salimicrobium TaxID=351195 RepID=A0ABY1L217_9BACI|nr:MULTISPECIES: two-component system activity regulator YycH [Salimicrobium]SDY31628.1 Two-component signal transduction system YycFG, regulatory protein YycH [Salimicrobium album]SIS92314.1 Two-component signal transduction system YycFG, regulatory protein YycH [Salimicrobium salexigens]
MSREAIKTIILIILVAFSLLLTLALWNYQPNLETVDQGDGLIEETDIGGTEKNVRKLLTPEQIIQHDDGTHYGYKNPEYIEEAYRRMQYWTLFNISVAEAEIPEEEGSLEIIFPSTLSSESVRNIFPIENQDVTLPSLSFDRAFVQWRGGEAEIRFLTPEGGQMLQASVRPGDMTAIMQEIDEASMWEEHTMFQQDEDRRIYLPAERKEVPKDVVVTETLPSKPLKNVLFEDPSVVKQFPLSGGDLRHSDGLSRMDLIAGQKKMHYLNLVTENSSQSTSAFNPEEVLQESVSFVNNHYGFTDPYRVRNVRSAYGDVSFDMYYNNRPILKDSENFTGMNVRFEEGILQEYTRPMVSINPYQAEADDSGENQVSTLASGKTVETVIIDSPKYDKGEITDIEIGYKLVSQGGGFSNYYDLIPAWFIRVNDEWKELKDVDTTVRRGGGV